MDKYNLEKVEFKISLIEKELEKKIVEEICKEFSLDTHCYSLGLQKLHAKYFGLGFCYVIWRVKKKILLEQYNIIWKSPSDLSPDIMFD
jgi:hypothetical protein